MTGPAELLSTSSAWQAWGETSTPSLIPRTLSTRPTGISSRQVNGYGCLELWTTFCPQGFCEPYRMQSFSSISPPLFVGAPSKRFQHSTQQGSDQGFRKHKINLSLPHILKESQTYLHRADKRHPLRRPFLDLLFGSRSR